MRRLLGADAFRMFRGQWFWLSNGAMLLMSIGFVVMQYTAMDYSVPISRVIFLPMSFYGVIVAALVSLYIGQDFNDGCIRNKLIAGRSKISVYLSNLLISCIACLEIFIITTLFTVCVSYWLFPHDVGVVEVTHFILLGIPMSLAYGCIFSMITMLCGNRTTAIVICMFIAFLMLFLCLHTNQIMVQPEFKNDTINPHYVSGIKKEIYAVLHDLNPYGQATQLSTMKCFQVTRWILCDLFWGVMAGIGSVLFEKKDIK